MATDGRSFSVGRTKDCDVVIADESVSRRHAEITPLAGGRFLVTDNKSTHGTALMVDGAARPIVSEIVPGDALLRFGDVTMALRDLLGALPPAGASAPAAPGAGAAPTPSPARLVRCECGTVKPKGERCTHCGSTR